MGNQPRLVAVNKAPGSLLFTLRDAANVDVKTGRYIGELALTITDANHIVQTWRSFNGGKAEAELVRLEPTRKAP